MKQITGFCMLICLLLLGCATEDETQGNELFSYMNALASEDWKSDKFKVEELQKIQGVLLFNDLPIVKDSILIKVDRRENKINAIGYYHDSDLLEFNEFYVWNDNITLHHVYDNELKSLYYSYSKETFGKLIHSKTIIVDEKAIEINEYFKGKTEFRSYNRKGALTATGQYEIVGTNVDTIITFDPFTYEEKIKVIRGEIEKTGEWLKYHDGKVVSKTDYGKR